MRVSNMLVLLVAMLIFVTCNDRTFFDTSDSKSSTPSLASGEPIGKMVVITREDDNPSIVHILDPQRWDGHSTLQPNIYYHFLNVNEIRSAFSNRSDVLDRLNEILSIRESQKKILAGPQLAVASYFADAWMVHIGNPGTLKSWGGMSCNGTPSGVLKTFEFWVWDTQPAPEVQLHYHYTEATTTAAADTTYYLPEHGCGYQSGLLLMAETKVSQSGVQKAYDYCSGMCDSQEYHECY